MRYELHDRDGKLLGRLDLLVPPVEIMQNLQHTAVVLGPAVCDVLPPAPDESPPEVAPVAVAVPPKARKRTRRKP